MTASALQAFEAYLATLEPDLREAVSVHTLALKSALEKERSANKLAKTLLREDGIMVTETEMSDVIDLGEADAKEPPRQWLIKVIKPGWGSTGYYAESMLKRDGKDAFPRGTHMYVNHPSLTEETDRPERDLRDLGAVLMEDAHWTDGPRGPGLYAKARVFEAFRPFLKEAAPYIGASIHALGTGKAGEAEGKEGLIIEKLLPSPFNSVDFVTKAGAGGAVVAAIESASPISSLLSDETTVETEERANTAQYLSAKLHAGMTNWVDEMFSVATITDDERKVLMEAIEASMDAFHTLVTKKAPDLFVRVPWSDLEATQVSEESESIDTPTKVVQESDELTSVKRELLIYQMREQMNALLETLAPSLQHLQVSLRKKAEELMKSSESLDTFSGTFKQAFTDTVNTAVATAKVAVRGLGERDVTDPAKLSKERAVELETRMATSLQRLGMSAKSSQKAAHGRN